MTKQLSVFLRLSASALMMAAGLPLVAANTHRVSPRETISSQKDDRTREISGIIADVAGKPVIGASVFLKGTTTGAASDIDGKFTITAKDGDLLEISSIGFLTQQVEVAGQSILNITMLMDTEMLDETIVIGYGTAKRRDFAGSVASMKMEDSPVALQAANSNALEALKGTITGLDVGASTSAGGTPSMMVRGQNSISGSNDPLLIVDGVIFMGSINDINPNDIATIDVLKDASSVAVYGSRASNGVIAVTTKKGKSGKPVITLNASNGFQTWAVTPGYATPQQWLDLTAARNGYSDYSFLNGQQLDNYNAGKTVDWLDLVSRAGYLQDYSAAISGAAENVNYYFSAAYTDNKGVVEGDDYNRITIKGKFDTNLTDWLQVGADASYARADYSGIEADLYDLKRMSPYATVNNSLGGKEKYPNGNMEAPNPLWGVDDDTADDVELQNNFRFNAFASVDIPWIQGLNYRINYSTTMSLLNEGTFYHENYYTYVGAWDDEDRYSATTASGYLSSANGSDADTKTTTWVVDNILTYSRAFGRHNLDLTAVATRDSYHYVYKETTGTDFAANGNTLLGIDGLAFATTKNFNRSNIRRTNIGYLGRAAYNFKNTYYLTASFRRDGASVFGDDTKWGNFGAVGASWRVSNERFMERFGAINDLRLKVSWGRNGNQGVDPYGTLSQVTSGVAGGIFATFGNTGELVSGIAQSNLGNKELGWETTEAWNFGVEAALLNNRINIDFNYYRSKTFDQLFTRTIPSMNGFTTISASMGEVRNKGVELNLRTINIQHRDFSWSSGLTFWRNRDKLQHLYGEDLDGDGKEDDDLGNSLFIGESIHSIYGYRQIGIVQEEDTDYQTANGVSAGTPKYADTDGDGYITTADRTIVGNTAPSFKLNWSNTLQWKNLQLYMMIAGTFGGNGYYQASNKAAYIWGGDGNYFGVNSMYVPGWTAENRSDTYPATSYTGDDYFLGLQSRGFVRLQDVTLSWQFTHPLLQRAGIQHARAYISGKNLLTITGWDGNDPEVGLSMHVTGFMPVMRTVSLGVSLTL